MRKKVLFPVIIILMVITCTLFMSDGLTYSVFALMALVIMIAIKSNRSWVMKLTRWGKANPHRAQVFITVLQLILMALGIIGGYNFKQLGYEFSNSTAFVFGIIMITGFLSVHFLPKRSTIAIPAQLFKHRFIFMSISLSSFIMMVITGNRIEDMYPSSPITTTVKAIDKVIFPDNSRQSINLNNIASQPISSGEYNEALPASSTSLIRYASYGASESNAIEPPDHLKKETRENLKIEKKIKRLEKRNARSIKLLTNKRLALAAGIGAAAVIGIVLLVIPLCAGICLIISGFAGAGAGSVLGGAVLTAASIWGIVKLSKGRNPKNVKEP